MGNSVIDAVRMKMFRHAVGVILVLSGALSAHAVPTAVDQTLQLDLEGAVNLTFNIHDIGMVSGGPTPVFLLESAFVATGTALPPGLTVTRVENACMQVQWTATSTDPFPEPFAIGYTLLAGDGSMATGVLRVEQGGEVYPAPTSCAIDPRNSPPAAGDFSAQTPQDTALAINPEAVGAASDEDGNDTLRLTDTACWLPAPMNGSVVRDSDDQLTYTPNPGFIGSDTFGYCVTDNPLSNATGASGTISVTVQAAGAPGLADDTATTNIGEPVEIDVLANDPIGVQGTIQSATASVQGGTTVVLAETACPSTVFGQGCIRYTPPPPDADGIAFVGTDSFSYVVTDPNGVPAQASVVVTVVAAPGTPEANPDSVSGVAAGVPTEIDVLANDSDDAGVAGLVIVNVSSPSAGTAVITDRPGQTQVITYTATDTFTGTDSFVYTISDNDPTTIDRVGRVTVGVVEPAVLALLTPFAENDTQRAVASTIDVVCPALGELQDSSPEPLPPGQEALLDRCSALIEFADGPENADGVRSALQQIAGEEVLAQGTTGTRIINTQIRNIGSRLSALRAGARGISAQGLAMNFQSGTLPAGMLMNWQGAGGTGDDDTGGAALLADSRLGIFINGRLNFGKQDTTENEDGFDFDTYGVTLGADYRFSNNFVLGGAVGYADSSIDFNFDGGDMKTEGYNYSLYGTYFTGGFYVDTMIGTGNADFDTRRVMSFADNRGGVDTIALGTTDGDLRLASINAGYNFESGGWVIAPYVSYDYMDTDINAYDETEGQGWELSFDSQTVQSKILTGGLRIAYNYLTGFGVVVPHFRAAFQRELDDDVRFASVRFVNDPFDTEFRFASDVGDTDFFRVGAGLSMVFQNGISGFVDYESIQGYENLTSSTVTAGLRFERRFR